MYFFSLYISKRYLCNGPTLQNQTKSRKHLLMLYFPGLSFLPFLNFIVTKDQRTCVNMFSSSWNFRWCWANVINGLDWKNCGSWKSKDMPGHLSFSLRGKRSMHDMWFRHMSRVWIPSHVTLFVHQLANGNFFII